MQEQCSSFPTLILILVQDNFARPVELPLQNLNIIRANKLNKYNNSYSNLYIFDQSIHQSKQKNWSMSFIERFQGKINKIEKAGLKQTLFKVSRVYQNPQSKSFNQSTRSHQLNMIFKKGLNSPRLRRTESVRSQNGSGYNSALPASLKNSRRGYDFGKNIMPLKSKPDKYIDQMLQRHKNLLQLIDKKTNWKEDKK